MKDKLATFLDPELTIIVSHKRELIQKIIRTGFDELNPTHSMILEDMASSSLGLYVNPSVLYKRNRAFFDAYYAKDKERIHKHSSEMIKTLLSDYLEIEMVLSGEGGSLCKVLLSKKTNKLPINIESFYDDFLNFRSKPSIETTIDILNDICIENEILDFYLSNQASGQLLLRNTISLLESLEIMNNIEMNHDLSQTNIKRKRI
ncbi:hypothetical protein ACVV7K_003796 [Cronobacter sakazakii]